MKNYKFGICFNRFPRGLGMTNAFGLMEVIVAIGLWIVLISAGSVTLIGGLQTNRLADETAEANSIASEGLDGMKAIKKQGWLTPFLATSCVSGCGLATVSGTWAFSGTNNVIGKYTRQVSVNPVNRDVPGNIVTTGGSVDSDTYLAKSTVTWSPGGMRSVVVSVYTYLTNYAKSIATALTGGIIIYGDGTTTPKFRNYQRATDFGVEQNGVTGDIGKTFQMRTSPIKDEAVAGYITATGVLQIMCFDGTTWSNEWSVNVGGTSTTRRFDIAYETNSGDVMILYSKNVATTNELGYRVKLGPDGCGSANWVTETAFNPTKTSGIVLWVRMAWDKRGASDLIVATWSDNSAFPKLSAAVWSGSAWTETPTVLTTATSRITALEYISVVGDVDSFDADFESISGDIMIIYGLGVGTNGTNGVRYVTCTGGSATCTWSAVLTPPTWRDDATVLELASDPVSDQMVFSSIGNAGADLQVGYWSGTAWTNRANLDTSAGAPLAGTKLVATGWLVNAGTSRYVNVYMDSTGTSISWNAGNTSGSPLKQGDFVTTPAIGDPKKWIEIKTDPINTEQMLVIISDVNNDLFVKKLSMTSGAVFTWSDVDGGTALETALPQAITKPFAFCYWRQ